MSCSNIVEDKKFGILMFTYNRNELLKEVLTAIQNQTYSNFEVIVLDRGSEPPAKEVVEGMNDARFKYLRSTQEIHAVDSGNEIIKDMDCDYFVIPGDDDLYLPNALKLVKLAFDKNPHSEFIQIGMSMYHQSHEKECYLDSAINEFSYYDFNDEEKLIVKYDGKLMAKAAFTFAQLGDDKQYNAAAHPHPTAMFVKKSAIDRNWENQKGFLLKTFGDTGFMIIAWQNEIIYLNIPLAVFTVASADRDTEASRRRWIQAASESEHLKIKVPHSLVCGADSILKCIHRNGIQNEYDAYLRFSFYTILFNDVIKDKEKDWQTVKDLMEIVPPMLVYPLRHPIHVFKYFYKIIGLWCKSYIKTPLVESCKSPKIFLGALERLFIKPFVLIFRKIFGIKKNKKHRTIIDENSKTFDSITSWGEFIDDKFKTRNAKIEALLLSQKVPEKVEA
jgi:glycosyltransferase involved in cell wall biosynthesis